MIHRYLILVFSSTLALSAAGCGKKHKNKTQEEYFVHGNPLDLVANTDRTESFLTPENLATFNGFHASYSVGFREVEPLQTSTGWDQVEKENSTEATETEVSQELALVPYAFRQESATRWVWGPSVASDESKLGFNLVDGKLVIADIDGFPVKSEHYSLKSDGRAFSVLFSLTASNTGRLLLAYYFAASDVVNPFSYGTADYQYLIGTAKLPWEGDLSLDTCGSPVPAMETTIASSLNGWLQDPNPTATRRTVSHTVRATYPPFSDLNVHCVLPMSNFKLENMREFYVAGATIRAFNRASKTLIDSDIMMFMDHAPVAQQMLSGDPSETLTHEIGHFFGLGHEFRVAADGQSPLHPSIMGYSRGTSAISEWDFAAIKDLYGQSLGAAGL